MKASARSFWLNAISGAFVGLAEALVDTRVVMSAFLSLLTDSNVLISFIAPMREAGWWLPQFFVSGWVERTPRKADLYRATNLWRIFSWLALIACAFTLKGLPLLLAFAICMVPISIGAGIAGLPWTVITAKTIPPGRRGSLFAWRNGLASILGIAGGGVIAYILNGGLGLGFPQNYGAVFAVAALMYVIGYALMGMVQDDPDVPPAPSNLRDQAKRALKLVKTSHDYRWFLISRSLISLGYACAPFFAVYARRELNVSGGQLGSFVSVSLIAGLIGNWIFGKIGDSRGHKVIFLFAITCGIVMALDGAVLVATRFMPELQLYAAYALSGLLTSALAVSFGPLMMDVTPTENRSLYYGFTHTLLGISVIISGFIGFLADAVGLTWLFMFSCVVFAGSLLAMAQVHRFPAKSIHVAATA